MRIAVVVPSLRGGGAEFVAREWAIELTRRGHDVTIYQTHPKADATAATSIPTVTIAGRGFPGRARTLGRHFREHDTDVAIALMPYWNLLALAARIVAPRVRTKIIISARNMVTPLFAVHGLRLRGKHLASKLLYRRADAFIAISHPVAAESAALYGLAANDVFVVPNPAAAKLTPRPETTAAGASDHLTLVVPARLVQQKRPQLAIEVARQLRDEFGLPCSVQFFGRGPLRTTLERLAADLDVNCTFDWHERWFDHCRRPAVVVLPSLSEGFGNVLVEAAGRGIPSVVSSRCLGSADAVVPGVTGTIVPGSDVDDFTRGVLLARRITVTGVEAWLDRFSVASSTDFVEQAISHATGSAPHRLAGQVRGRPAEAEPPK